MKKFKSILSAIVVMAMFTACGNNGDDPTPGPTPGNKDFHGVVFATGITNPEGSSGNVYLQALPSLLPGTYDNSNSIPCGFGSIPIVTESGNVYTFPDYMGNTKAEINRYRIMNDGTWKKEGALSIPAGAAACNIVEASSEKAYVSLQGIGVVMVFNPTTMTKIADIDLNNLKQTDTRVAPAAMIIRDGKLFVGLNQMNAQYMPTRNNIELAMIDVKSDKVEKHIVNESLGMCFATRPIDAGSIFMDENKDIYFNCVGSFGFVPGLNGGIARIKNGSTEIDSNFLIRLDKTEVAGLSTHHADYISRMCYDRNGLLYAYVSSNSLDANAMTNPYIAMTNVPVVIDLKQKSMTLINDMEISNPQGIAVAKHKNMIVFGSANKKATGFYTYNPDTKKVAGPILQVKGNPCFFHSFEK